MRYIKLFEELNPKTYIKAGQEMEKKYQYTRGEKLIKHGNDLIRGKSTSNKEKVDFPYTILIDDVSYQTLKCKFLRYEILLQDDLEEDNSITDCIDGDGDIWFTVVFYFEDEDGDDGIVPFEFVIDLYSDTENRLPKFNISIKRTESDNSIDYGGMFTDRKSANLFLRNVVSDIPNDPRFSEIVSILQRPSSDLEKIYSMFDNIDIHYLYDDKSFGSLNDEGVSILKSDFKKKLDLYCKLKK